MINVGPKQGIFTTLRDRNTLREDFIFFTDRLSTLLSEKAMEFLPYAPKNVITPISATYAGRKLAVEVRYSQSRENTLSLMVIQNVCGVSILRS